MYPHLIRTYVRAFDIGVRTWYSSGMDLGFALQGRPRTDVSASVRRELDEKDLRERPKANVEAQGVVKRLTDSHHACARYIAQGFKPGEVASLAGYSQSRISILQTDPAFMELVAHYREMKNAAFGNLAERMANLSLDAESELRRRLEEEPEGFDNKDLTKLLATLADRTGFGPKTTQVNVNVNLADRIREAQGRLLKIRAEAEGPSQSEPPILDAEIVP